MSVAAEILFGLAMAIGLVGVLIPVVPGLVVVGFTAILWAFEVGTTAAWMVTGVMLVLLVVGTVLKYQLPGRELKSQEVPTTTWALAGLFGIIGFFAIPVIGAAIGFVVGAYIGERRRFSAHGPAWESSKRLIAGIGKGLAVEFAAGLAAIIVWIVFVVAT